MWMIYMDLLPISFERRAPVVFDNVAMTRAHIVWWEGLSIWCNAL